VPARAHAKHPVFPDLFADYPSGRPWHFHCLISDVVHHGLQRQRYTGESGTWMENELSPTLGSSVQERHQEL